MFRLSILLYIACFMSIAQAQDMEVIHSSETAPFPTAKLEKKVIDSPEIAQLPSTKLEMVIIDSTDLKQFPQGKLLNSSTFLDLPAETKITVAFNSGGIHKVIGPYQGIVKDPRPNSEQLVFDFYSKSDTAPESVGIVEGLRRMLSKEWQDNFRGLEKPLDIWFVDATSSRARFYCIAPSSNVTLWRPESQTHSASLLLIKHKGTGQKVRIVWPAHQTTLEWPKNLPIVYGDTYTVEVKPRRGSSSFKKLVLYQLPESLPTKSHKVVWMAGRGCIPQANMLLASLH